MTGRRVIWLLVAGLVVITFAVWLSSRRNVEPATLAGDAVLTGLGNSTLNTVSEVELSKGDGTRTTLSKGSAGWVVKERGYPADSGKVRKLLLDLAALNVIEEKTRTPANYPALGVEATNSSNATGTRVDVVTPAKTFSLIVGKPSGAKSGYVRAADSAQSVLAAPLITLDADPRQWLDRTLIDIPQERIKEVSVKPAAGPSYTATRADKDHPDFTVAGIPKGRELSNPAAADPIAGSLGSVTLDDVQHASDTSAAAASSGAASRAAAAPPAPAASPAPAAIPTAASAPASAATAAPGPISHAVFRTFDGLEIDVAGHKEGTKTFVSLSPRSASPATEAEARTLQSQFNGWEFEVPSYKYDGLFRPLEDLLKKLPEPAAKKGKDGAKGGKPSATPPSTVSPGPGEQ